MAKPVKFVFAFTLGVNKFKPQPETWLARQEPEIITD